MRSPLVTASVGLLLLACGDGAAPAGAGAPADAGADAAEASIEGSAKGVSVRVVVDDRPVTDLEVYFNDAAGTLLGEAHTDRQGWATFPRAAAQVTVIDRNQRLITFTGLADGAVVLLTGDVRPSSDLHYLGRYLVRAPGAFPGATGYDAWLGNCTPGGTDDPSKSMEVLVHTGCASKGDAVLVRAGDKTTGAVMAFAWKAGIKAPMADAAVSVTAGPWSAPVPTTLTRLPGGEGGAMYFGITLGSDFIELAKPSTAGSQAIMVPNGVPGAFVTIVQLDAEDAGHTERTRVDVRRTFDVGPFEIDPAPAALRLTASPVEARGNDRFELRWAANGSLDDMDGGVIAVKLASGSEWRFVVPPGTTSLVTPALPVNQLEIPGRPEAISQIAYLGSDALDGYAAFYKVPTPWTGLGAFAAMGLPAKPGMRARSIVVTR